ncbi:MAG TPA: STAS domain-containing protein [Nocardioidaceae bacterium]|nr:STAS domain-containing protein [Nocardioidaceae bacterium]
MHEPSQRSDLLNVSVVPEAPYLFLALRGELDLCSVKDLPRDDYASREDLTTVLVDLGGLRFCDLSGLRALQSLLRTHEAQGRTVEVVRATPFMWRLMRMCGITYRLDRAHRADIAV